MIASGYLPYLFSENLCNGKLVYALAKSGICVDVISKVDSGPTYGAVWTEPWLCLKSGAHIIDYPVGNKFHRLCDVFYSGLKMGGNFNKGIRWVRRAYDLALLMMKENRYDAVLTRSPSDFPHLVGYMLKKKYGIRWIANWNDPAAPIWPKPYTHHFSTTEQKRNEAFTSKMLSMADVTTFPSDSLRQHFIQHFPLLKERHTEVIPHVALHDSIFPSVEKNTNKKLMFCHSGNLSKERNPELTFRAMRELIDEGNDNFEFHIMGVFNDFTTGLIEKYNLEDYVKCIGSFPYIEAIAKLQLYDVLVLLEARLENGIFFASKFTDYAQTNLPILAISPKHGFAVDMINQYGGGLAVNNEDPSSIKEGLKILLNMKEQRSLSEFSSRNLYRKFSAEEVVWKYKNLLYDQE